MSDLCQICGAMTDSATHDWRCAEITKLQVERYTSSRAFQGLQAKLYSVTHGTGSSGSPMMRSQRDWLVTALSDLLDGNVDNAKAKQQARDLMRELGERE